MLHARDDYNRIQDPDGKIPENEPVFLLRAQDVNAPEVVENWAFANALRGGDRRLSELARAHAVRMREWQRLHGCKAPDLTPNALAQADAACGVSPGAMGSAAGNHEERN